MSGQLLLRKRRTPGSLATSTSVVQVSENVHDLMFDANGIDKPLRNAYASTKTRLDEIQEGTIVSTSISFMSSETIEENAVVEVTVADYKGPASVCDPRMGVVEYGMLCPECQFDNTRCLGHMGFIRLNTRVINPLTIRFVIAVLNSVCNVDGKLLVPEKVLKEKRILNLKGASRLLAIEALSNSYECSPEKGCTTKCKHNPYFDSKLSETQNRIVFYKEKKSTKKNVSMGSYSNEDLDAILSMIDPKTCELLGFEKGSHPKNYIIKNLAVIPNVSRQPAYRNGELHQHGLTIIYRDIVKINNMLGQDNFSEEDKQKYINALTVQITKLLHDKDHSIRKIMNSKDGVPRRALMGKRTDFAARTVISPDPTLAMGQSRIPAKIMRGMTTEEIVTPSNKLQLTKFLRDGLVKSIIPGPHSEHRKYDGWEMFVNEKVAAEYTPAIGDKFNRQYMDGDIVLVNRQPTLSDKSMQGIEAVVASDTVLVRENGRWVQKTVDGPDTLGNHISITTPMNADHDGDEMNMHFPQTSESKEDVIARMSVEACLMSGQTNSATMGVVYNNITMISWLSDPATLLDEPTLTEALEAITDPTQRSYIKQNMAKILGQEHLDLKPFNYDDWLRRIRKYNIPRLSGRALVSALFPSDFEYKQGNVVIKEGVLVSGLLTKENIGPTGASIVGRLYSLYNVEVAAKFVTDATFVSDVVLPVMGLSLSHADCNPTDIKASTAQIREINAKTLLYAQSLNTNTTDPFELENLERKIMNKVDSAKNIGDKIVKEYLAPDNVFKRIINAGTKGNLTNVAQVMGQVGQQFFGGKRMEKGLAYFDENDPEMLLAMQGYISSSFYKGMNPYELLYHQAAGRQGLIDTNTSTAQTGYIQHMIIKALEDLRTDEDGSVRNSNGVVFQDVYAGDGLNPSKLLKVPSVFGTMQCYFYPHGEIERINRMYEDKPAVLLSDETIGSICNMVFNNIFTGESDPNKVTLHKCATVIARTKLYENTIRHLAAILIGQKIVPEGIPSLVKRIVYTYNQAKIKKGESVGVLTGNAISAPITQAALNSFHQSGSSNYMGSNINRIQGLVNMTNPPYQTCTLHYTDKMMTSKQIMQSRKALVSPTLNDLVDEKETTIEDDVLPEDEWWMNLLWDLDPHRKPTEKYPILRVQLYKYKIITQGISIHMIAQVLEQAGKVFAFAGPQTSGVIYLYATMQGLEKYSGKISSNVSLESMIIPFLNIAVLGSFESFTFKGVEGISYIYPNEMALMSEAFIKEEKAYSQEDIDAQEDPEVKKLMENAWEVSLKAKECNWNGLTPAMFEERFLKAGAKAVQQSDDMKLIVSTSDGKKPTEMKGLEKIYHYATTSGSNLRKLVVNDLIDVTQLFNNNVKEMYEMYGIEVARTLFIKLFIEYIGESSGTDVRHVIMLADFMFNQGHPFGINFRGLARQGANTMTLLTVQKALTVVATAAALGRNESISGASANIMFNVRMPSVDYDVSSIKKPDGTMIMSFDQITAGDIADAFDAVGEQEDKKEETQADIGFGLFDQIYMVDEKMPEKTQGEDKTEITLSKPVLGDQIEASVVRGIQNPELEKIVSSEMTVVPENVKEDTVVEDEISQTETSRPQTETSRPKASRPRKSLAEKAKAKKSK